MGLISRVSSRTYRRKKDHLIIKQKKMSETWKTNLAINAKDHLVGRLCSIVAKELLRGNTVNVVCCEGLYISGNYYRNKLIMLEKMNKRTATNPKDGPFHHRSPAAIVKRMVRGMLPNKTGRGQKAYARLNTYDGCPPPFNTTKKFKIPSALKVVRSRPGRKIASIGRLCSEVGWQYGEIVGRLEAKRVANAQVWFEGKQKKLALRASAEKAASSKTASIDKELAAMGY